MKHATRIIIALLIVAMMIPMVISCADTKDPVDTTAPAETVAPGNDASQAPDETTLYAPSNIPDDLKFDGETIKLLYWDDAPLDEFFVEQENGEAVNDAIFKRNAVVQEQFGVTLDFTGTHGDNGNQTNFVNACMNSVQSGSDAHDLFCGYSMTGATIMTKGIVQDLTDYEIMEFEKPWWPKSLISKATVNDAIYFASGDISTNYLYMMYLCAFNKKIFSDIHQLEAKALYDHVYNGSWTIDKFIEYNNNTYADLNSDGAVNEGDQFGLVVTSVHFDAFFTGADMNTVEFDAEGKLAMSDDLFSPKALDLLDKVCNLLHDSGQSYIKKGYQLFAAGQALFVIERASITSKNLTNVDFTYGILPIPKYNSDQKDYRTCLSFPYTVYMLSNASKIPEASAATLELMAYQSYINITPALFEESMKLRYADQSDDAFMFDYIRDGVVIDVGRLFTTELDKLSYSIYRNAINNNGSGYASSQKGTELSFKKKIQAINETLEKLGS